MNRHLKYLLGQRGRLPDNLTGSRFRDEEEVLFGSVRFWERNLKVEGQKVRSQSQSLACREKAVALYFPIACGDQACSLRRTLASFRQAAWTKIVHYAY